MAHNKNCRLCGGYLPKWREDLFSLGKDSHRKQCSNCGKCLTGHGDHWGKCKTCWERAREKKEERIEMWMIARREKKEMLRVAREEKERLAQAERVREQQARELELRRIKETEVNQYRQLRKEIEAMPLYQQWRQDVLKKFDKKCAICSSTENIEVDHRYESFHSIVRRYGITSIIQAYECPALWDINNGAPLCKLHHDQTKNSVFYNQNNS